jgi:hypothetical protein
MGWRHAYVGREGDQFALSGVKVWQHEWRWVGGRRVTLPNPLDSSRTESHMVIEAGPARRPARFAASKLPSGLWSFYVPD